MTAGASDAVVQIWAIQAKTLEAQIGLGGEGNIPFLRMLDASGLGVESPFYKEMEDYFYYAQLRRYLIIAILDILDSYNSFFWIF